VLGNICKIITNNNIYVYDGNYVKGETPHEGELEHVGQAGTTCGFRSEAP